MSHKKIKVLFLPSWYPCEKIKVNGIFVQEHAKAAQLFDNVAILYGEPTPCQRGLFSFWKNMEDGLPTFRFRYGFRNIARLRVPQYIVATLLAFRKVIKIWGVPDVIHAQDHPAAFAALLLRMIYGIPYVVSVHWTGFGRRLLKMPQILSSRLAFAKASRVFGVNNKFRADFQFYSIHCDFRWLPNCIDKTIFYRSGQPKESVVLHCSLFDDKKRIPDLIRAFALCQQELPQARIELIGNGGQREIAESLANTLLIPNSFTFHGLQPKWYIAESMRKAKVFVLPSSMETFGCVLIEAMACGTPVIASNIGGIPNIVSSKQGILIPCGDIQSIAQAIKSILSGEIVFEENEISRYAADNFSREAVGRSLHEEHHRSAAQST